MHKTLSFISCQNYTLKCISVKKPSLVTKHPQGEKKMEKGFHILFVSKVFSK